MNHKNRFLINHTGFLPEASKKFVYDGNADSFTVCRLQDLKLTPVFEGSFEWRVQYGSYGVGDFSGLCEEGIYRIHTEDGNSRCFVIWENAYDPLARILLNFLSGRGAVTNRAGTARAIQATIFCCVRRRCEALPGASTSPAICENGFLAQPWDFRRSLNMHWKRSLPGTRK